MNKYAVTPIDKLFDQSVGQKKKWEQIGVCVREH